MLFVTSALYLNYIYHIHSLILALEPHPSLLRAELVLLLYRLLFCSLVYLLGSLFRIFSAVLRRDLFWHWVCWEMQVRNEGKGSLFDSRRTPQSGKKGRCMDGGKHGKLGRVIPLYVV